MHTAKPMQTIITAIAAKHGLDLTASEAHLKLTNSVYQPLVIEKIGKHLVSVAHYRQENGDTISDPDVVFFTRYVKWVPVEISQVLGYRRVANLTKDGQDIESFLPRGQRDVAEFCVMWAQNIHSQGWLEHGEKAE